MRLHEEPRGTPSEPPARALAEQTTKEQAKERVTNKAAAPAGSGHESQLFVPDGRGIKSVKLKEDLAYAFNFPAYASPSLRSIVICTGPRIEADASAREEESNE
jgi:hypothetical protein